MVCRTMQDIMHNAGPCMAKCRISCRTGAGGRVSLWILWITARLIHIRLWITRRKPSKSDPMARNKLIFIDCIGADRIGIVHSELIQWRVVNAGRFSMLHPDLIISGALRYVSDRAGGYTP